MTEVTRRSTHVLLVEADPPDLEALREAFADARGGPMDLECVEELADAMARLSRGGVDAVLLNPALPDSEGIGGFDRLQAFAPDVPVVILSDSDDEELAVRAVQGGAQDYLLRSEATPELLIRAIRYGIERHRLLSALRSLSLIDDLTGLYNRRGFADLGEQYVKLARRSTRGVALVFLDIDRFKTINDTLGHHVGDRALLRVADLLKDTFRRSDIIARMGGDEFAVLALEASGEDARMLVDRLRAQIGEFNESSREPYRLSVSIGLARCEGDGRVRLEDLLEQADAAMYEEKRSKRRTVAQG
ncbi:MAG: diguanylate cyclase [Gemmatimonadetes bacterium]|nr:MAG: diguanylate cyclase [Gemmatimonadota bacterium]